MRSTRTVLVTGAGRGIGRAIAVRLARSGWQVYGGVRTDVAAKELVRTGGSGVSRSSLRMKHSGWIFER